MQYFMDMTALRIYRALIEAPASPKAAAENAAVASDSCRVPY